MPQRITMTHDADSRATTTSENAPASVDLTLAETLRVMDVATTLRREQIEVQKQLNLDETKRLLREKLLETAEVTGEDLTPAEIDAAIEQYFDNLHAFEEPKFGPAVFLAHLYIRRGIFLRLAAAAVLAVALVWAAVAATSARTAGRAETMWQSIQRNQEIIADLTSDKQILDRLRTQTQEAAHARQERDLSLLESQLASSAQWRDQLESEYEIRVVSKPGEQSAVDRYYEDDEGKRESGYYLIVEAVQSDGSNRSLRVRNRETGAEQVVTRWAEQVPKEVYDRLAQDKREDGVLDETLFARKIRGEMDLQVVMTGNQGQPLERRGQITSW